MKAKVNLKNMFYYMQGNLRYKLFYSKFAFLLNKHIREQIEVRIKSMDKQCYMDGQCKICGCETTALQMANKACDKPCYPSMLSRNKWGSLKKGCFVYDRNTNMIWGFKNNKFYIIKK